MPQWYKFLGENEWMLALNRMLPSLCGEQYNQNLTLTNTVIPRLTSDPANEFFG